MYSKYVFDDKLISPINGHSVRSLKSHPNTIKKFGFNSFDELEKLYPGFPHKCKNSDTTGKPNNGSKNKMIKNIINYNQSPKYCKNCSNALSFSQKKNIFCSKSCRTTFNNLSRKKESNTKISKSLKKYFDTLNLDGKKLPSRKGIQKKKREIRYCKNCDSHFLTIITSKDTFCNSECKAEYNKKHKLIGGYRNGTAHKGKGGYFKGIWCDSTYELAWVIFHIDHNISFKRFNKKLYNQDIVYIPDFIIDNTIIEIKGYYIPSVDVKQQLAIDKGYEIIILYRNDMNEIFDYVTRTYNVSEKYIFTLYDNYKPKFKYTCNRCDKEFLSHHKRNGKV